MNANLILLIPRREHGWRMGLGNMLAKELSSWWRTRRWWVQCLLALFLLNGIIALNLKDTSVQNTVQVFLMISALCIPFTAINLGQDSILGERHSGTAAWVLSKPLRRPAYILSKVLAHGLGVLVAWIVIPGAIAYFQFTSYIGTLTPLGFAGAMGLSYLNLFFYLTLALMLATFFDSRGPVLGISLTLAWSGPMQFIAQPMQKFTPWLPDLLPWKLLFFDGSNPLAGYLAQGQPLPTVTPIIATLLWSALFVGVAIWRFRREEF